MGLSTLGNVSILIRSLKLYPNALMILLFFRSLDSGDFSDDFHTFELEWTNKSIGFYLDGEEVGTIAPPEGGFWKLGEFDKNPGGENVWKDGGLMAPFDQEVKLILIFL